MSITPIPPKRSFGPSPAEPTATNGATPPGPTIIRAKRRRPHASNGSAPADDAAAANASPATPQAAGKAEPGGWVSFSVIQSSGRLSKTYRQGPDGIKDSGKTFLVNGGFVVGGFDADDGIPTVLDGLGRLLETLTEKQAIALGVPKGGAMHGGIAVKEKIDPATVRPGVMSRSLDDFGWPKSLSLLLLDGDGVSGLPKILTELWPGFRKVAMLVRPSASASFTDPNTGKPFKNSEHVFVVNSTPELSKDCLQGILRLAWCHGSGPSGGRLELSKDGKAMVRGPVDVFVGSPERLIYEGKAALGKGLTPLPRKAVVTGGAEVLNAFELIAHAAVDAPQDEFDRRVAEAKRDPAFVEEQNKRKAAHRADYVEKEVKRGKSREQAESDYDTSLGGDGVEKHGRLWHQLPPGHVIYINGKPVTAEEIAAKPRKYHKMVCADPVEGLDYQSTTCGWIVAEGGQVSIYSQAHGGARAFSIPLYDQAQLASSLKQVAASRAAAMSSSAAPSLPPMKLDQVHATFTKWLSGYDIDALNATLACSAAEQLDGDPAWLLLITGPGGAKTETVTATSGAGAHITSTIASEGALLSGVVPRGAAKAQATGGLLRKIGTRGILVIKDFTSILSAHRDARATVLAALREIYDGYWERNVGSDGGRTLTWAGRLVVIGAVTTKWDAAHEVISACGDRFVLLRMDSTVKRVDAGRQAIINTGSEVQMRSELALAVGGLLGQIDTTAKYELEDAEIEQLLKAADVVTYARTAVERDYQGEVIDAHAPEMPTRFAKQLAQVMRGALAIGLDRKAAMALALRCARDSVPPLRLAILLDCGRHEWSRPGETRQRLDKPWRTVKREMEALHMLGLLDCRETPDGNVKDKTIWRYRLSKKVNAAVLRAMDIGASRFKALVAGAVPPAS